MFYGHLTRTPQTTQKSTGQGPFVSGGAALKVLLMDTLSRAGRARETGRTNLDSIDLCQHFQSGFKLPSLGPCLEKVQLSAKVGLEK